MSNLTSKQFCTGMASVKLTALKIWKGNLFGKLQKFVKSWWIMRKLTRSFWWKRGCRMCRILSGLMLGGWHMRNMIFCRRFSCPRDTRRFLRMGWFREGGCCCMGRLGQGRRCLRRRLLRSAGWILYRSKDRRFWTCTLGRARKIFERFFKMLVRKVLVFCSLMSLIL